MYRAYPDGVRPNDKKVAAVTGFPVPKTVKEIKNFLGLTKRFISEIAALSRSLLVQEGKDNWKVCEV